MKHFETTSYLIGLKSRKMNNDITLDIFDQIIEEILICSEEVETLIPTHLDELQFEGWFSCN